MGIPGMPSGMPDMPQMPDLPDINTDPGKLSNMQLQMKAQEVPDSATLNKWREAWNSKFPASQQFTEQKFQQFIGGLFKFLQYLIKHEKEQTTQASQDLKKSESGDD
ncbi:MAG: hypothetical protein KBC64_02110 [Simkaniaceae bacterium]|nr:hypothetical protein [Simkaniaceae bacterium]